MCKKCTSEKENSLIVQNYWVVNVCDPCKAAHEAACMTRLQRQKRAWQNHKIIGHREAKYGLGTCLEVLFENGTGISVLAAGHGEYMSRQRAPQHIPDNIYEIVYEEKEKREGWMNSEFNARRDCRGVFPSMVIGGGRCST